MFACLQIAFSKTCCVIALSQNKKGCHFADILESFSWEKSWYFDLLKFIRDGTIDSKLVMALKLAPSQASKIFPLIDTENSAYLKVSNIRRSKSQNLNASRLIL